MKKSFIISILIHLFIFLIFWKITINSFSFTHKEEKVFQVSLVTANEYDKMMSSAGYSTPGNNMDLPQSNINSEDVIRADEMESTKLTDNKHEIIPPNILKPKNINAILPGMDKELTTISSNNNSDNRFYTLNGIITTRRIMLKYLPEYPKGYHVNTTVVLGISIDDKGNIVNINIVKRGGAPFDGISVNAARKWKFEPLPNSGIEKGTLTFFYRLK